jgi:hypothetical protein
MEIKMDKLQDILDSAREELKEYAQGEIEEISDAIHEIADGQVPVYTSDLMELAAEDIALATREPELGPAFDGSPTPVNIVAANVYEAITEALWEYWNDELEEEYNNKQE